MSISQNKNQNHTFFMKLAFLQAKRNLGNTKENPSVGCVIINNKHVVSAACTGLNGRPHAEYNAIKSFKKKFKNLDLYVTIEPCSHYGKTPPCVNMIIDKKIKRVFFSIKDPDKRSFDKSTKIFKKNKINVKRGFYSKEISDFYRSYIKSKKDNLPFTTCKIAVTKDFFMINKKKKFITNEYSRGRVHLMRSMNDCVITSSTTVINDNPRLSCRINGLLNRSPSRIILDRNLKIPLNSKLLNEANSFQTIIFFNKENIDKTRLIKKKGIKIYKIPLNDEGNLDLRKALHKVKNLGFNRIFLECGPKLSINFIKSMLVDDLKIFVSNERIGLDGEGNIKKELNPLLKGKKKIHESVNLFGESLLSYKMK